VRIFWQKSAANSKSSGIGVEKRHKGVGRKNHLIQRKRILFLGSLLGHVNH
jgi:hypothetical protein